MVQIIGKLIQIDNYFKNDITLVPTGRWYHWYHGTMLGPYVGRPTYYGSGYGHRTARLGSWAFYHTVGPYTR